MIEVDDETVRFTHPLLASTVYADASSEERRSAHRRLARAVVDDEERARHLALAARGPDEEVAAALDLAASTAFARGAPDSAADLEDLAVRLTPAVDERSIRSRLLRVSTYRYSAGDVPAAREVLEGLIDATPIGPERAGLRFELSDLVWNDVERVRRLLDQVREDAGEEMSVELDARVELAMGWVGQMGGDLAEGSRHGRNALAAAEALDRSSSRDRGAHVPWVRRVPPGSANEEHPRAGDLPHGCGRPATGQDRQRSTGVGSDPHVGRGARRSES